jgi:hypothetical protein
MSYKFHVGELKPIQWFANPQPPEAPATNPVNLTGLNVEMKWQDSAGGAHSAAMTVAADGLSASYNTVAGDLPVAGVYKFQFFAYSGSAGPPLIESDVVHETVGDEMPS